MKPYRLVETFSPANSDGMNRRNELSPYVLSDIDPNAPVKTLRLPPDLADALKPYGSTGPVAPEKVTGEFVYLYQTMSAERVDELFWSYPEARARLGDKRPVALTVLAFLPSHAVYKRLMSSTEMLRLRNLYTPSETVLDHILWLTRRRSVHEREMFIELVEKALRIAIPRKLATNQFDAMAIYAQNGPTETLKTVREALNSTVGFETLSRAIGISSGTMSYVLNILKGVFVAGDYEIQPIVTPSQRPRVPHRTADQSSLSLARMDRRALQSQRDRQTSSQGPANDRRVLFKRNEHR
ncbi:MAG: hypothetical protein HC902_09045 [Calothrix sp. SM1_5_4]|nr:hypothetical protein [Calothrix sp. SM1_5_4]